MKQIYEETLQWLIDFIHEHHYAPTYGEIGAGLLIGRSTVHYRLRRLKVEGRVDWQKGRSRTLIIL